jgi:hypothetical protein
MVSCMRYIRSPGFRLIDGAPMIPAEIVWKPNYSSFGFPVADGAPDNGCRA